MSEHKKFDLIKRLRAMARIGWNEIGDEAADEIDRLHAELAASEARNTSAYGEMAELRAELAEARRLLDEARKQEPVATLVWSGDGDDVVFEEFAQTFDGMKLYAAPVPAQPAVPDDVAKDAARYRAGHPDMILDEVGRLVMTRKYADAQMVELVRQIAKYPSARSEEMCVDSIRARCRFAIEQYDAAILSATEGSKE